MVLQARRSSLTSIQNRHMSLQIKTKPLVDCQPSMRLTAARLSRPCIPPYNIHPPARAPLLK